MIAYTAWDSLQAMAQTYDADLKHDARARVILVPHRDRFVRSALVSRMVERVRRGLGMR